MRYIGSKTATLPWLTEVIARNAPAARSVCDPFAGTCVVGRHLKQSGMRVTTGDVLPLSYTLQQATVGFDCPPPFHGIARAGIALLGASPALATLAYLEGLPGEPGYVHREFCPEGAAGRSFFTPTNAARIDAIRRELKGWTVNGLIDTRERAFLLASLIEALDRVANTAGTYYAHLKDFSRKALLPLRLGLPPTTRFGSSGGCHLSDASDVVAATPVDILYLDPPYNKRDYSGYYHLPDTIARGDEPEAHGRSGAPRRRTARSDFYRSTRATAALAQLCAQARARHIIIHYTTEGVIGHDSIVDSLSARGPVSFEDRPVRAYASRAGGQRKEAWHRLYWCDVKDGGP